MVTQNQTGKFANVNLDQFKTLLTQVTGGDNSLVYAWLPSVIGTYFIQAIESGVAMNEVLGYVTAHVMPMLQTFQNGANIGESGQVRAAS